VVLGFVGAGGLGQQMDNSMKMFNGGEVPPCCWCSWRWWRWPTGQRRLRKGLA
jgi:hypothetical protein